MNHLLKDCALVESCAYIKGYEQTTHYKIIEECSAEHCEQLILRGWRRFGNMFFRPVCHHCHACESVKIDALNYTFSKSARRIMKKCRHFSVQVRQPSLSQQHLDLFERYHAYMRERRGWENQPVNARNYYMSFVYGHGNFGYEVLYFDDGKLIAVDLIDILPTGISSIYFYYDPEYAAYSLGKYSLYRQIRLAQKASLPWIYLGYYVEECQSLAYKADYQPLLVLDGRPDETETPRWFPYETD